MDRLPVEIKEKVFDYLPATELAVLAIVCKQWRSIAEKILKLYRHSVLELDSNTKCRAVAYLFKNLKHLKRLSLNVARIEYSHWKQCTRRNLTVLPRTLKEITIDNCALTADGLYYKQLNLNQITKSCPAIEYLTVVGDFSICGLNTFRNLKALYLKNVSCSGKDIYNLCENNKLESFNVEMHSLYSADWHFLSSAPLQTVHSLVHLSINPNIWEFVKKSNMTLQSFSRLRFLTIAGFKYDKSGVLCYKRLFSEIITETLQNNLVAALELTDRRYLKTIQNATHDTTLAHIEHLIVHCHDAFVTLPKQCFPSLKNVFLIWKTKRFYFHSTANKSVQWLKEDFPNIHVKKIYSPTVFNPYISIFKEGIR